MYLPFAQSPGRALFYFVATRDPPLGRLQDVRLAVRDVEPELPVLDLRTMTETMSIALSGSELGQKSLRVNAADRYPVGHLWRVLSRCVCSRETAA